MWCVCEHLSLVRPSLVRSSLMGRMAAADGWLPLMGRMAALMGRLLPCPSEHLPRVEGGALQIAVSAC